MGGGGWSLGVMIRTHKRIQLINTKERGLCNDTFTEEKIILKFILILYDIMDWLYVAQGK
jgi:hypothetical protein